MKEKTAVTQTLENVSESVQYDNNVKQLLSNKIIKEARKTPRFIYGAIRAF